MKACCQSKPDRSTQTTSRIGSLGEYTPLIVLLLGSVLMAVAKQIDYGGISLHRWMHDFMGFFLVVFAMLKLFDLGGFVRAFQKYDLLAKNSLVYARVYPFLELVLGMGYLSFSMPNVVYTATIVLMGGGTIGVLNAIAKKQNLKCACMGATLNVPLTSVALIEDLAMVVMAAIMLIWSL